MNVYQNKSQCWYISLGEARKRPKLSEKKYEEIWIQNNVKFLCGKNKWKGNWWTMKA